MEPADNQAGLVEEVDGEVLVREVGRRERRVRLGDQRRIGERVQQRRRGAWNLELACEQRGHVGLKLHRCGYGRDHPRLREVDGKRGEHLLRPLIDRGLPLRRGQAAGQRGEIGLRRRHVHEVGHVRGDERVPVCQRVRIGVVDDRGHRRRVGRVREGRELGQLALQHRKRRVGAVEDLVVRLLHRGADSGEDGARDLVVRDAGRRGLRAEHVDQLVDGEAGLADRPHLLDESQRRARISERRGQRARIRSREHPQQVVDGQVDDTRQRHRAVDEAQVRDRQVPVGEAEERVCVCGRDLQGGLNSRQVVGDVRVGDRGAGLQGREVCIRRHGGIEEQPRVQRDRARPVRVAMVVDVEVLEEGELLVGRELCRVLKRPEREERDEPVLVQRAVAPGGSLEQQVELPEPPAPVSPQAQEPVYAVEHAGVERGGRERLPAQVAGVVDALERERAVAAAHPDHLQELEQLLVRDRGRVQEGRHRDEVVGGVGCVPCDGERDEVRIRDQVDLVRVDLEALHGDAEPIRKIGVVDRKERLTELPEGDARLLQVGAELVERAVVRERVRVARPGEGRVRGAVQVLRRGAELGRGTGRLLPDRRARRTDRVLEQLVDEVDIRQRHVGVGAVEQQVSQVRPAIEQGRERCRERSGERVVPEPEQEVADIRRRAEDRRALAAGAVVDRAEERGKRLVALDRVRGGIVQGSGRADRCRPLADEATVELRDERDDVRVTLGAVLVDPVRLALREPGVRHLDEELLPAHRRDLRGRVDPQAEKRLRAVDVRDDAQYALEPPGRVDHRRPLLGLDPREGRVARLLEVRRDAGLAELELRVVDEEARHRPSLRRWQEPRALDAGGQGGRRIGPGHARVHHLREDLVRPGRAGAVHVRRSADLLDEPRPVSNAQPREL